MVENAPEGYTSNPVPRSSPCGFPLCSSVASGVKNYLSQSLPSTNALDAVLQMSDVEVDQQADVLPAKAEIRQKLSLMDGMDAIYGLDLDNDGIFDQQIDAIPQFDFLSLVDNGQSNLGGYLKTRLRSSCAKQAW